MIRLLPLATLLALACHWADSVASTASLERQLLACRVERDSAQRLICYDQLSVANGVSTATDGPIHVPSVLQSTKKATPAPFGLPQQSEPELVQAIRSELQGRFLGWQPGSRIALTNGQVWQIDDNSSAAYDLNQPRIRIERGRFGSFFLHIDGVAQTPRVRRLS